MSLSLCTVCVRRSYLFALRLRSATPSRTRRLSSPLLSSFLSLLFSTHRPFTTCCTEQQPQTFSSEYLMRAMLCGALVHFSPLLCSPLTSRASFLSRRSRVSSRAALFLEITPVYLRLDASESCRAVRIARPLRPHSLLSSPFQYKPIQSTPLHQITRIRSSNKLPAAHKRKTKRTSERYCRIE